MSITQMVQKYTLCTTGGHVQNSTFSVLLGLQTHAKIARAMFSHPKRFVMDYVRDECNRKQATS